MRAVSATQSFSARRFSYQNLYNTFNIVLTILSVLERTAMYCKTLVVIVIVPS